MAIEAKRGCGFRKVGGLYLVGGNAGGPCCKMPIPLEICPCCGNGVKQTRGWTWIDPRPWLKGFCLYPERGCPMADPAQLGERVGLLWIGAGFYPTADAFIAEANAQGISRRITAVPRNFKLGESWVFLAHPKAIRDPIRLHKLGEDAPLEWRPGVFRIFRPTAIEKIVTVTQSADEAEMLRLHKAGVTPVVVPDGDRDHMGTVYDDEDDEPALALGEATGDPRMSGGAP